MNQNELFHHGILGQKWGVRRFQNADGSLTALGKARRGYETVRDSTKKAYSNHKVNKAIRTGKVRGLSDEELERAISRISLEKRFKDIEKDTKRVERGKKIVGDILESGSKKLADKAFSKLSDKIFNKETESERISREAKMASDKAKTVQQKIALDKAEKEYAKITQANEEDKRISEADKKRYEEWLKKHR